MGGVSDLLLIILAVMVAVVTVLFSLLLVGEPCHA
jgi:hypothetical protein